MKTNLGHFSVSALLIGCAALLAPSSPLCAQQASDSSDDLPPVNINADGNGVDVTVGTWLDNAEFTLENGIDPDVKIARLWLAKGGGWAASWDYKVTAPRNEGDHIVTVGADSFQFSTADLSGGQSASDLDGRGAQLSFNSSTKQYTFIAKDGTTATLDTVGYTQPSYADGYPYPRHGYATSVVFPSGKSWSISYDADPLPTNTLYDPSVRMRALQSSLGVGLRFSVASDGSGLATTIMYNAAIDYCPVTATTCALSSGWPQIQASSTTANNGTTIITTHYLTDSLNNTWTFVSDHNRMQSIQDPVSASATATLAWSGINTPDGWAVSSHTLNGITHTYTYSDATYCSPTLGCGIIQSRTTKVTDPNGGIKTYVSLPKFAGTNTDFTVSSFTDELGRITNYGYDSYFRLSSVQSPELNTVKYTYDSRGNLLEKRQISKTPNSPPDVVTTYVFPGTCPNVLTCNKPTAKIDPRTYETDYSYDPSHGGLLTETGPAVNGIRPQKRYTYVQRYAWLKNAGGTYSSSGPIWVLSTESYCRNSAASGSGCSVAGDEVVKTYDYGPDSGPNNLLLRGFVVTADGTSRRTCFSYDSLGHKISETSANANLTSCP